VAADSDTTQHHIPLFRSAKLVCTVLGTAIALAVSRWVQPLLFEQSATDPRVYTGVGALLIAVALLASAMPAWRAAGADPNAALRAE
jgi:ABC-type lipoprotein release transport system permease subunit